MILDILALLRSRLLGKSDSPLSTLPEPARVVPMAPVTPPTPMVVPDSYARAVAPGRITRDEILMGRDKEFPLSPELEANLARLLVSLNKFRDLYGKPMVVTSGYRPGRYNTQAGGAIHSAHIVCMACDFSDPQGDLDAWIDAHPESLVACGLWRESPASTVGWTHLQTRPVGSGSRTFLP